MRRSPLLVFNVIVVLITAALLFNHFVETPAAQEEIPLDALRAGA